MGRVSRRTLFKGVGGALAFEFGPQLADPIPVHTKFAALPEQNSKIEQAASRKLGAWLVAAGLANRGGRDMASIVQGSLEVALPDRPIFYVNYGNRSHDPNHYAQQLEKLQQMFGRIAFVGQSIAPLMLGSAANRMNEKLKVDAVLADCTPRSDETTRFSWAHSARGVLIPSWYPGGTFGTMISDFATFGNPLFPHNSAHLALTHDQLEALLNGDHHVHNLRRAIGSGAIFFARLSPENPDKDKLVNPTKSVAALKTDFPELVEAPVGSVEGSPLGHSNPWKNPIAYAYAIAALPWQDLR